VSYLSGFGNEFATEAVSGALPRGQNSPQRVPYGLYAEQLSGSAFTAPRKENKRSWLYRLRPSAEHAAFQPHPQGLLRSGPFDEAPASPNRLRWSPPELPSAPTDFVDGLVTFAGNGDAAVGSGLGIHMYVANRSMVDRVFYDADGELLIVPQAGKLRLFTELGVLEIAPGEIGVVPRGVRFRAELPDGKAIGYVCENYGAKFTLPDRGPIGANCLANPRDFKTPVAAYEDKETPCRVHVKWCGKFYVTEIGHSPLDVVAWHGNYAPFKYDLRTYSPVGAILFDHPDPSIFTVLTAPTEEAGTANIDFVIFPPRWLVAEHTFRPPWYHRNIMSEFMGLIHGQYDAKEEGFVPGGMSLHNMMLPHGPDATGFEKASNSELKPVKLDHTMAFMFETRFPQQLTKFAAELETLQDNYLDCWDGLERRFDGTPGIK